MKYFYILLIGIVSINLSGQKIYTLKTDKPLEYYTSNEIELRQKLHLTYDSLKIEENENERVNAFFRLLDIGKYNLASGLIYHDSTLINIFDRSGKKLKYVLKLGEEIDENQIKIDLIEHNNSAESGDSKTSCKYLKTTRFGSGEMEYLKLKKNLNILLYNVPTSYLEYIVYKAKNSKIYLSTCDKHDLNMAYYDLQTGYCINKYRKKRNNKVYVLQCSNDDPGTGNLKFDRIFTLSDVDIDLLKKLENNINENTIIVFNKSFDDKKSKRKFEESLDIAGFKFLKSKMIKHKYDFDILKSKKKNQKYDFVLYKIKMK